MKSIEGFETFYRAKKKITMVTCYDYWSANIIYETNIDAVLVGDSAAMVMHGYDTTINADMEMMVLHTSAVRKGLRDKLLISDIPFLSHLKGRDQLLENADKLFKAGAQGLKIEGAENSLDDINYLVKSGIPVMGHLGMTPQSVHKFGGFRLQGHNVKDAEIITDQAKKLQNAGCFSIVLEMIPSELGKKITDQLSIPTIGIGAGPFTSGQILVLQDMLGMNKNFNPKFLKKYADGNSIIQDALNNYNDDVKSQNFPSQNETY